MVNRDVIWPVEFLAIQNDLCRREMHYYHRKSVWLETHHQRKRPANPRVPDAV